MEEMFIISVPAKSAAVNTIRYIHIWFLKIISSIYILHLYLSESATVKTDRRTYPESYAQRSCTQGNARAKRIGM
jgi:hypothetical protein